MGINRQGKESPQNKNNANVPLIIILKPHPKEKRGFVQRAKLKVRPNMFKVIITIKSSLRGSNPIIKIWRSSLSKRNSKIVINNRKEVLSPNIKLVVLKR